VIRRIDGALSAILLTQDGRSHRRVAPFVTRFDHVTAVRRHLIRNYERSAWWCPQPHQGGVWDIRDEASADSGASTREERFIKVLSKPYTRTPQMRERANERCLLGSIR
jgi:hypothetical protein